MAATIANQTNAASPPGPQPPRPALVVNRVRSAEGLSRFVETPMHEYTPANSIYEDESSEYEGDDDEEDDRQHELTTLRLTLRGINAALHFVACLLLLTIMALFLDHARRRHIWFHHTEPQAVTLNILLAGDMLLDAYTLATLRLRRLHHPGAAILARLALGVSYIALFMVYVGVGAVFPRRYAFWGLTRGVSGPVVYLFLWMIGVWNLLHTALHRHQVGRSFQAGSAAVRRLPGQRRPGGGRLRSRPWSRWLGGRRRRARADQAQQQRRQRGAAEAPPLRADAMALHNRLSSGAGTASAAAAKADDNKSSTTTTTSVRSAASSSSTQATRVERPPAVASKT